MNKCPSLDEFAKDYIGNPSFLKEAYQWFLLGRVDAMMQVMNREQQRMEKSNVR